MVQRIGWRVRAATGSASALTLQSPYSVRADLLPAVILASCLVVSFHLVPPH